MKSALARKKAEEKAEAIGHAANVYRVALSDLLNARPGESLRDALARTIDERIAAHEAAKKPFWRFWS